jgi:hypothetical protein
MSDEIEFIKDELKKRGYPLENYIQSLLAGSGWHVQPNAYFLDKDTEKGRELDIKATFDNFKADSWTSFLPTLLVQCRRLPGNAWIFFSVPKTVLHLRIAKYSLMDFLEIRDFYDIFDVKETHFDKREVLATNYCEIITDKNKSNRRNDNIWECAMTLIKATSQDMELEVSDTERYLTVDISSDEFFKDPFELISIFYPVIVFDGKMYEAKFSNDEITLERREYIHLFIDYMSGRYKGTFCIDVVTKERFQEYLKDVLTDLTVFNLRRVKKAAEYEKAMLDALRRYYSGGVPHVGGI